ncbi:hypothetical protein CAPTEDRAFT_109051 [Capitella teleta]|uniref:Guanylate cyclase n=1 Tax=Capitella teleta TaxID=283909 RepID=R7TYD6_CAPTE|nr:hypothetical protein CAPTEDRAFT_109051 [Capitella teleta]|eukprot:ELT98642.1 hypothetical protein CAPTEDRAFT_109051 [Capitella teleta]
MLFTCIQVHHTNILRVYGVTFIDSIAFLVSDHCPKGTLSDVVQNEKYRIDDNIKFSLAMDIASGMTYLHSQGFIHSHLTSNSCYIDHRWNVKVADWEHDKLKEVSAQSGSLSRLFFVDPELLGREKKGPHSAVKANDVFSFAMILVEIFTREDPYSELSGSMEPCQIIEVISIIEKAWSPKEEQRPGFSSLRKSLRDAKPSKKSIMDSMMDVLEMYVGCLEEKVAERTADLAMANTSLRNLLHQILPPTVAEKLSKGESVEPECFSSVSIFFSDIVGFTHLSASSTPLEVVTLLNDLYTAFDAVVDRHQVYKVETIGDSYMVISGLPQRNGIKHAGALCTMALDLLEAVRRFRIRHRPDEPLQMRAGIHSGSVVAGVVGLKMPRYCLFGDTVNTASRMESTSEPMRIQVSETTYALLAKIGGFSVTERGSMDIKVSPTR